MENNEVKENLRKNYNKTKQEMNKNADAFITDSVYISSSNGVKGPGSVDPMQSMN